MALGPLWKRRRWRSVDTCPPCSLSLPRIVSTHSILLTWNSMKIILWKHQMFLRLQFSRSVRFECSWYGFEWVKFPASENKYQSSRGAKVTASIFTRFKQLFSKREVHKIVCVLRNSVCKKVFEKSWKKIIQKNAKRLYCLIIDFPKNKNEIIKKKKITKKKKRKIEYTLFLIFKKWWITFIETSNKKQGMEIKQ